MSTYKDSVDAQLGKPVRVTGGNTAARFPRGIVGRLQEVEVEVLGEMIKVYQVFNEAQDINNVDQPGTRFTIVNVDVVNQNTKGYPEIVLYPVFEVEPEMIQKFK